MTKATMIEVQISEIENSLEKKESPPKTYFSKFLFVAIGVLVVFGIGMILFGNNTGVKPLSVNKLEQVNKVLVYDTILFEGSNLSKLQNNIYKDLKEEKQNINYIISNPELLVIDFNTREFNGNRLAIGSEATIDISYDQDKKVISYSNFTKEGREIIVKQIDKNNYPKIKIQMIESKNSDDTYNINLMIDSNTTNEIEGSYK